MSIILPAGASAESARNLIGAVGPTPDPQTIPAPSVGDVLSWNGTNWVPGAPAPAGSLQMFAGASAPLGYLLCDGAAVSRTTYAALFAVVGTTYGAGNGTTTFNLPDLRGRGPIGAGTGAGLTPRTLGSGGGSETIILDGTTLPAHTHTGTTDSNGTHSHTSNAVGGQGNYGLALADGTNTAISTDSSAGELNVWTVPGTLTIDSNGGHQHTFTSGSTGGGQAHANMQPWLAVNFIIKT